MQACQPTDGAMHRLREGEGRGGREEAMRDRVVVDGVELTRSQVERAKKALEEPEEIKPGMVLRDPDDGCIYLVLAHQEELRQIHKEPEDTVFAVGLNGADLGYVTLGSRITWSNCERLPGYLMEG